MKKTLIIISLFLLGAAISVNAQEMTQKERTNYAIGALLGEKIKEKISESGIDPAIIESLKEMIKEKIDFESIKAGVRDFMKGECKLTKEEIEADLAKMLIENQFLTMIMNMNQNDEGEGEEENPSYTKLIKEAWAFYESEEYLKSGQKYAEAFVALGDKEMSCCDRYNAACAWALANETDAAFEQLFMVANSGSYPNLAHITTDTDLNTLHKDKRWADFIEIIKSKVFLDNLEKLEKTDAIPEKYKADVEKMRKRLQE